MKIVLRDDVEKLGRRATCSRSRDGYARNYLVPRGLAIVATKGVVKQAAAMRRNREVRDDARRASRPRARRPSSSRQPVAGARRARARAASSSARSRRADIVAAIEAATGVERRPAQDHARRAAQGARPGRGRGARCTPTSRVTVTVEVVAELSAPASSADAAPHPAQSLGGGPFRVVVVPPSWSHRDAGQTRRVDVHSPVDDRGPSVPRQFTQVPGVVHFHPTGPRCDDAPGSRSRSGRGWRGPVE